MSTGLAAPVNAPLDLRQRDHNSCLSCVTANILHMFGAGSPDPRWVDRQISRRRGVEASYVQTCLLLQACGFQLYLVGEFDPERFLAEGLDYLREYHSGEWTPDWDDYWTPGQVAIFQQDCLDARRLRVGGAVEEYREPTLDDLRAVIASGGVVSVSMANGASVGCHAELIYGYEDGVFDLYSPQYRGTCLYRRSPRSVLAGWLRDQGMTGIWRCR